MAEDVKEMLIKKSCQTLPIVVIFIFQCLRLPRADEILAETLELGRMTARGGESWQTKCYQL